MGRAGGGWRLAETRPRKRKQTKIDSRLARAAQVSLQSTGRLDRVYRSLTVDRPGVVWVDGSNDGFLDSTALLVGGEMDGWVGI